ncbi:pleiotropic drug resistance ABC transporter [Thelephora ganbajun]|uniref:Pleiotropic drug resistance ABC transporter n=1 Tax=Thelephora ganbajun TaxID=370292 RepID=A0ACB6Z583_THEGA|nr:pleiotropic drug resistance ABC transporter [Thelephora ganbajun]
MELSGMFYWREWISASTVVWWLGTITPCVIIVYLVLLDLAYRLKPLRGLFRWVTTPFTNFLVLEDLLDPVGKTVQPPVWKRRILVVLPAAEALSWIALFFYTLLVPNSLWLIRSGVSAILWSGIAIGLTACSPSSPPYLLLLFCLEAVITAIGDLYLSVSGLPEHIGYTLLSVFWVFIPSLLLFLLGTLPLQPVLPVINVARVGEPSTNEDTNPEDAASLWQWMSFSYVEPVFKSAGDYTLNEEDVWTLSPFFKHKNIFHKCLQYFELHPTHSLLRFLIVSNSLDLILDLTLELWSAVVGFVPPFALQRILAAIEDPSPSAKETAYFYAFVTFLANLSFAQKDMFQTWHTRRCYERTRGQLFCALHYKALKRRDISGKHATSSNDEGEEETSADLGKVVNLMQGDAYAVAQRFWEFSGIFAAPVRLAIALVFLYRILGWSSLAAVAVVLAAYILNWPLAMYNILITRASWKAKDKRMNIVNELFQNLRLLKCYGWERFWESKVTDAREDELKWRVRENVIATLTGFIWTWMPSATALSTFLCYTLLAGEKLSVSKAFTAIALFSYLQEPMTALPGQIFALLHAYVSMQRIEAFLKEDEVPDWASSLKRKTTERKPLPSTSSQPPPLRRRSPGPLEDETTVGFEKAIFTWNMVPRGRQHTPFKLGPLNLTFPTGRLSLVSGATGSGKTALLLSLLGEMACMEGKVLMDKRGGKVGYCAQTPWLEHATIRDNIIFGSRFGPSNDGFDEVRYDAVLEACALKRDLAIFEAGDLTEIGEKGITLSGGQRARIALARALYSHASCILLDDPLAAVDMHTAQHLVAALSGPLGRDRTIILVTHHISLCLPISSFLVELFQGSVRRFGFVDELRKNGYLKEVIEREDLVPEAYQPVHEFPTVSSKQKFTPESEPDVFAGTPPEREATSPILNQEQSRKGKLIEAEKRAEGRVSYRTYWTYVRAAGVWTWMVTVFLMIFIRLATVVNQVFIAAWSEAYGPEDRLWLGVQNTRQAFLTVYASAAALVMLPKFEVPWKNFPPPEVSVRPWVITFSVICSTSAVLLFAYTALGYYASLQASRSLFLKMLGRLVRAPSRFLDVTPIGRILNRFTADINAVDGALQNSARGAISGMLNFLISSFVIIWVVPNFAPVAVVLAWFYIRIALPYIRASRDLRRLESISLSPAFAGFDELLNGLPHIRAFAMEERYQETFYEKVDKFQSFDHVYWLCSGWLRWRYDCLGSVVVFFATTFALLANVSNGLAAIVIVQSAVFAEASRQLVRVLAQVELDFNSVERIVEYLEVPQEGPLVTDQRPPAYWPSTEGQVHVENLVVKYSESLPHALDRISFTVQSREKIGVVGRTGSGKSTLALSLLRMVEATEGKIVIDGIDISTIGLEDLRSRVTMISQDVALFSGTVRSNLDPFEQYSDVECLDVLRRCHLTALLERRHRTTSNILDMPIDKGGSLSAGERQLMALARAILRRTSVIIMDEATSQIDVELDEEIQRTIREELQGTIVLTIAHRLNTVLDYDRVLVLGEGRIIEFDTPASLLKKQGGVFRTMCRASSDWSKMKEKVKVAI